MRHATLAERVAYAGNVRVPGSRSSRLSQGVRRSSPVWSGCRMLLLLKKASVTLVKFPWWSHQRSVQLPWIPHQEKRTAKV